MPMDLFRYYKVSPTLEQYPSREDAICSMADPHSGLDSAKHLPKLPTACQD